MITQFDKYLEKKKKLDDYKSSILKLVDDFININPEFCEKHKIPDNYNKATGFYFSGRQDEIAIVYVSGDGSQRLSISRTTTLLIRDEDYHDLLRFMEDPELYKNMKNYNL